MKIFKKLWEEVGDYYKGLLEDLKQKYLSISDVRGLGLFIGIEFTNPVNLNPDGHIVEVIKNELKSNGILVGSDWPDNNVIKSKPPLCFSKQDAKDVV